MFDRFRVITVRICMWMAVALIGTWGANAQITTVLDSGGSPSLSETQSGTGSLVLSAPRPTQAPNSNAAPTQAAPVSPGAKPGITSSSANSIISGGDLLVFRVLGAPDYAQEGRVDDQGEITLPYVGQLKVGGLSVREAERLAESKLSEAGIFNNPQVSIVQEESVARGIAVLGEVQKPGIYDLPGKRSLFEAISAAGGTSVRAGRKVVITHRGQSTPETLTLSYDSEDSQRSNVPVQPGDTIVVSQAGVVYVVGDVTRPTGIVLDRPTLTVLQAVALAEGTKPTAALDKAKVIRKNADGQQEIPLSLKEVLAAKAPDINLRPGDILFIPNSVAKSAGRRAMDAAIQMVTGIAIYARY